MILAAVLLSIVIVSGYIAAVGDLDDVPEPYSTLNPYYHTTLLGTGYKVGFFINPRATPLSEINFNDLKKAGITDIYVLANNDNYQSVLTEAQTRANTVGMKTNAWVYPGFKYAGQIADMQIGVLLDVETHNMSAYVPEIKAMRSDTQKVTFYLCVKPELWDGSQEYYLIEPYCDYLVPMLYIGDYGQDITGLRNWVRAFNYIFPRKVIAGLETYQSDKNLTPKSANSLFKEIKAVQPYTRGVILFRYGLSNYPG